jgi:glycosyltransferase involved in cell wall biosynthesis
MKALLVSHSSAVENMGGAELTLLQTIDEWRRHRPDIEFIVVARTPEGRLQPELERRGVPCITIDFDSWVLPMVREVPAHRILTDVMDSRAVATIAALIREHRPDVVVTNTIVSPWGALAAKIVGVPHVWFVHEYGDLDHGLDFRIGRDETFDDIALLSELVVANSRTMHDHLQQWIPADSMTIAYPPIDLSRATGRLREDSDPAADLRVVLVGRLARSKGYARLLDAIAALRDEGIRIRSDLIGGSSAGERALVVDRIAELGLEELVAVVGEMADPFPLMAKADVGIMASDFEAFGRVTVEYMALGLPVIAADSGANRELVRDGETGWIFSLDEPDALVDALRNAHSDRAEVRRRGEAARRSALDEVAVRWPLSSAIDRIEEVVTAGPHRMTRLPRITWDRLRFPAVVDQYAEEQAALRVEVSSSRTWKVGQALETAIRPVLPVAKAIRRARRQRKRG